MCRFLTCYHIITLPHYRWLVQVALFWVWPHHFTP